MKVQQRIEQLRKKMAELDLDAYFIPSTDPHQSEYVAAHWQRRAFISGFDGSAGTLVVCMDRAGLWTDSRYFLQAEDQLAGTGIDLFRQGTPDVLDPPDWLAKHLIAHKRIGFDPWVVSASAFRQLDETLKKSQIDLVAVENDLIESIWGDSRPKAPKEPIRPHPKAFAGESVEQKLSRLRIALKVQDCDCVVLGALDEIAWLFNLRGADVKYNPVFIAFAIIDAKRAALFVDESKVSEECARYLPSDVLILPYETFESALFELGSNQRKVWLDPLTVNQRVVSVLETSGASVVCKSSAVTAWKSVKNDVELEALRQAHKRDAVAMVRFMMWLESSLRKGGLSELALAQKLDEIRSLQDGFIGPSFGSIVAYADHGAIVHYSVDEQSSYDIHPQGILLVDSGGQYQDGTTDITRTIALGNVSDEHKRIYTSVLKGHLALTRASFPQGSDGYELDVLARAPLWAQGLDYGHGTGHGVGAALCVHEGPFSISRRKNLTPLEAGNVLSIEPGFYRPNEFGVRIENLAYVCHYQQTDSGLFLCFKTLTLCPYDRALIDISLLDKEEIQQIDDYHRRVQTELWDMLTDAERDWLASCTKPLMSV